MGFLLVVVGPAGGCRRIAPSLHAIEPDLHPRRHRPGLPATAVNRTKAAESRRGLVLTADLGLIFRNAPQ
jgi:hypothetical protein